MADNKRYYWLKLDQNFFDDDTIVYIEEQKNGKDYVIFYLKLLLKSIGEDGKLIRVVGETLLPYDVNALAKLTNTHVDTVDVAMKAFEEIGLVKKLDSGELYMTQINEMIGTETDSAKRVRKHRALKNARLGNNETLQCNSDVTKCNTELEIEKELEKELELEKDKPKVRVNKKLEARFDEFWELYPRQDNKPQAKTRYKRITLAEHDLIMKDLPQRIKGHDWVKKDGMYIPYASNYLKNEQWTNEIKKGNANTFSKSYDNADRYTNKIETATPLTKEEIEALNSKQLDF